MQTNRFYQRQGGIKNGKQSTNKTNNARNR